jgi:pheromone shutdown protein TraB
LFQGGDKLRFGDVITAVASLFLVTILISYPLETMLISILGLHFGPLIGALVSVLLGALIIGYVFSERTANNKREAIAKISILFTVLMVFSIILNNAVLGQDFTKWFHETYQESNPTASLTTFEWFLVGGSFIGSQMFMNVIVLFPFSFIGLYAGLMLKKTAKRESAA